MKAIEINSKTYQVPESWDEVTLEAFCECYEPEQPTKRDRVMFGLKLAGINYREFCKWKFELQIEVIKLIEFTWLTMPETKDSSQLVHNGITYKVPGNWGRVSVAEWVDLDFRVSQLGTVRAIPYVLAIYFRPEGSEEYDSDECAQRGEEFKTLKISAAWGAAHFFIRKGESLRKASNACLKMEMEAKEAMSRLRDLLRSGAGLGRLRRWRGKILLYLMQS